MHQARWARWIAPLLLLATVAARAEEDEGEWAPAGDYKLPRKSAPSAPAEPSAAEALTAASGSPALQPFVAKLAEVAAKAQQGDYADAQRLARQYGGEVANVGVTGDFIKHRTTLSAAFLLLAGKMEALLGDASAARRTFASVSTMAVANDMKAQAAEADACGALLQYDYSQAATLERRARQHHREAIQPALDGAATLFNGRPQPALDGLRALLGKGLNAGFTSLFATAAALCLDGRLAEAGSYFARPETAATGIWPQYYLISGLLDSAGGGALGAKLKFEEGARREYGRIRANAALAAVAEMAGGDLAAGAAALSQAAASVPGHFRPVLVDLLANPSRAAALQALSTPRYWLMQHGYRPGELLVVKGDALPVPPGGDAPEAATAPADETPAETPAADAPEAPALPTVAAPSGGGTVASDAMPADPGIASINRTTQAAKAYRSAVALIANHAYAEAETALDYSIQNEAYPEALLARGQLRYLRGEFRGAAADYAWAVKLRPDWAEAVYSLAQATDRLGDARRASQLFAVALDLGLPEPLADYARTRAGGR